MLSSAIILVYRYRVEDSGVSSSHCESVSSYTGTDVLDPTRVETDSDKDYDDRDINKLEVPRLYRSLFDGGSNVSNQFFYMGWDVAANNYLV